jgi:hypothetical protein
MNPLLRYVIHRLEQLETAHQNPMRKSTDTRDRISCCTNVLNASGNSINKNDFRPIFNDNIKLQHPIALRRSDFAFRFLPSMSSVS